MKNIKNAMRNLVPKFVLDNFHYVESIYYAKKFKHPSEHMYVIGIVGSKGKTTIANMLWSTLNSAGLMTGQISTANIRVGSKDELNPWHMTMPGPARMQALLSQMHEAGCSHVIMEVPSEAQTQWRHIGINFDTILFTGVTEEIMDAHKRSMAVLHTHNKRVFTATQSASRKMLSGKKINKTLIANIDNKYSAQYTKLKLDKLVTYSIEKPSDFQAKNISINANGTAFSINNQKFAINLIGEVHALNAAAVVATATQLDISAAKLQAGFDSLRTVPGRMEAIDEGQDFAVFVDYAHDQLSIEKLLQTGKKLVKKPGKVIVLFGGQGGGRDIKKRGEMGAIAARYADILVVTDDDPYDDDPMQIINDIANGAIKGGMVENKNMFKMQDRRAGIHKVLSLAAKNDLVFIACKGADQLMMLAGGKSIAWDDRTVTREELKKL